MASDLLVPECEQVQLGVLASPRRKPMKLFPIALALLAALPTQAMAQDAAVSVRVSYADLDLSSPSGVKQLDHRLARAIHSVCADIHIVDDIARQFATRRCIEAKTAEIAAQRNRVVAAHAAPVAVAAR
jgi:UrcA family protein